MKRKGFLSGIFGPSKEVVWKELAQEIGGEYEDNGFWKTDLLRYQSSDWEIVLDTYTTQETDHSSEDSVETSTTFTRMRAFFLSRDSLSFKIYRENFFSPIGKFFGMQDIQIGDQLFDKQFIVKANEEPKIKLFLQDAELKALIHAQSDIHFQLKPNSGWLEKKFPSGVNQLYFETDRVVKDIERLKNMFRLFEVALNRLVEIDVAEEGDPGVRIG